MSSYPEWILERSFGGSLVADTPGSKVESTHWPRGRSAAAAEECCDLLITECNQPKNKDVSHLVFLVGGAGNGKSYLAKKVTNEVKSTRKDKASVFASRVYDYELADGKFFRVINDATIPHEKDQGVEGDLFKDIYKVLIKGGNLLACVNRGVLVSEANYARNDSQNCLYKISGELIDWLLSGNKGFERVDTGKCRIVIPTELPSRDYYAFCYLENSGEIKAYVHVAFMDHVSLLEPFPRTESNQMDIPGSPLQTSKVKLEPLISGNRSSGEIPLKEVFSEFYAEVEKSRDPAEIPGKQLDPFGANLAMFSDPRMVTSLCSLLRGAEIVSGSHVTYREAWGVAVLSLLGSMSKPSLQEYAEWVAITSADASDILKDAKTRLTALIELALRRTCMALFSGRGPKCLFQGEGRQPSYPPVQVIDSLLLTDPLVGLDEQINNKILDKLTLLDEKLGPGEALANEDPLFQAAWTSLDQALEETLLEWMFSEEDETGFSDRNQVLSWYGQYLYRLYSFSHGYPAHVEIIERWQKAWLEAENSSPKTDLRDGFNRLVFLPFDERGSVTYLPVFAPRVAPISKGNNTRRTAIEVESHHYKWQLNREGDSLVVSLSNYQVESSKKAEIVLDFSMLRETLAQSEGRGFTDGANDIEPRLERLRAEVLSIEIKKAYENNEMLPVNFVDGDLVLQ